MSYQQGGSINQPINHLPAVASADRFPYTNRGGRYIWFLGKGGHQRGGRYMWFLGKGGHQRGGRYIWFLGKGVTYLP